MLKYTALALLTLAVATPTAGAKTKPTVRKAVTHVTAAVVCPGHVKGVYYYRQKTRSYERKLGKKPSRSLFNASLVKSCSYTVWVAHRWKRKLSSVREDYIEYLAWKQKQAQKTNTRVSYSGGGSSYCGAACVQCESGGNPNARSPDGTYWGLYQFDYSTWVAHGGNPGSYGSAGAAEQAAVASRVRYQAWPICGHR